MEYGIWSVECGVWNMEYGVWSMEYGVWSIEYGVWNMKSGVWNTSMKYESGAFNVLVNAICNICSISNITRKV